MNMIYSCRCEKDIIILLCKLNTYNNLVFVISTNINFKPFHNIENRIKSGKRIYFNSILWTNLSLDLLRAIFYLLN